MVTGKTATRPKRITARSTGRPPKDETQRIRDNILDVAAVLFFEEGYGATSIEAIARRAKISKRTLYHRFADKGDLFRAVVHRILNSVRPSAVDSLFEGTDLKTILDRLAKIILHASLSPQALALHRVILAEAMRFPELALIMNEQGMRGEAIKRIGDLLTRIGKIKNDADTLAFHAEQFLYMVIAVPQRRALGLGTPMNELELNSWATKTVALFLTGLSG